MEQKTNVSCTNMQNKSKSGILSGIIYGIIPHSFCIAFALFSIIGAVTATAFLKKILLIPNLFIFLVIISLALATVSSLLYLRKNRCLCALGIRNRWKYLLSLYSATILANLLMFFIVIPALANANSPQDPSWQIAGNQETGLAKNGLATLSINVKIPCSGHSSLIIDELKKDSGVEFVKFKLPDNFEIAYDPRITSPEKITSLEIFKTYEAKIN